ncbi:MAG TPA: hypothetical protein VGQ83_15955, partial [Polyangia bacterium]
MQARLLALVAVGGGVVVLVLVWLVAAARRAWRRRRDVRRVRRGHAGERRGRALLEAAGWRVRRAHPPGELRVAVDGEDFAQPLTADYLCERAGRVLPAEVKTGAAADLAESATRRQLLEYAVAYGAGATLFVDADEGTVSEVVFAASPPPARGRSGALLAEVKLPLVRRRPRVGWLVTGAAAAAIFAAVPV